MIHLGSLRPLLLLACLITWIAPPRLSAQQPLEVFVEAALRYERNLRATRLEEDAAEGRVGQARGSLLPDLTASATYRRNSREASVQRMDDDGATTIAYILPYNQLDFAVELNVPILDLRAWSVLAAARSEADGRQAERVAAELQVKMWVVAAWYRLVGARAIVAAAEQRQAIAEQRLIDVEAREAEGLVPQLDVARARSEIGLARQAIVDAQLEERLASRALIALTGITPDAQRAALSRSESALPALAALRQRAGDLPSVRAAQTQVEAAAAMDAATTRNLIPSVRGFARGRYTNASGFQPEGLWSVGVMAEWRLDLGSVAALQTADASLAAANARLEAARIEAETSLEEAWYRAEASDARVEAAEMTLEASERAASDASDRYEVGRGTQLDVLLAERELFDARVNVTLAIAQQASALAVLELLMSIP